MLNISYKCFSLLMVCVVLKLFKLKTERLGINRIPHRKVTKLKANTSLVLDQLNQVLYRPALI